MSIEDDNVHKQDETSVGNEQDEQEHHNTLSNISDGTVPVDIQGVFTNKRVVQIGVALVALVLLLSGVVGYYYVSSYEGRVYANVSIQGIHMAGKTDEEMRLLIEQQFATFLAQPVTFRYGDATWQPSMEELGVTLQIHHAITQALQVGHNESGFQSLRQIFALLFVDYDIPLHVTIDQNAIQNYIVSVAQTIEISPVDAEVGLHETEPYVTSSMLGIQVDVAETVLDTTAALQQMQPQVVDIRSRPLLPHLNDEEAEKSRRALDSLLQGPLTLTVGEQTWIWDVHELASMVRMYRAPAREPTNEDTKQLVITLDKEQVKHRLQQISNDTISGVVNPRVAWNGGDLVIVQEGKAGLKIDEQQAEELIYAAMFTSNRTIELPLEEALPPVREDNLHELGIDALIGVGSSDFTGSEDYRITNIQAGMNLLDGLLIAPDEEFSFNRAIGRISADNGFVEGYAIVENRTQLEWGGGICQDSTTLFRAAFWAGLPITERWGHAFYILWYDAYGYGVYGDGPGMDATIYTGSADLKFVNDTGGWLLIETYVDPSRALAEIALYGTPLTRTVKLDGPDITNEQPAPTEPVYIANSERPRGSPYRSDRARGGMDISFTRIIEDSVTGEEIDRQRFVTRFKPWPNIYEINPADLGPDGKPIPPATPTPEAPIVETTSPVETTTQPMPEEPTPVPEEPTPMPMSEEPAPVPEEPTVSTP